MTDEIKEAMQAFVKAQDAVDASERRIDERSEIVKIARAQLNQSERKLAMQRMAHESTVDRAVIAADKLYKLIRDIGKADNEAPF